jgi:hypothetical protein
MEQNKLPGTRPDSSSVAAIIRPPPERYSWAWYDWIESRDFLEALEELIQESAQRPVPRSVDAGPGGRVLTGSLRTA